MGEHADPAWLSATAAADRLRARDLTPAALVDACLDRIAGADADLKAWAHVDADGARAAAAGDLPDGPLRGVPVGVKDIFDVAGLPTTFGVGRYAGNVAARDAAAVARLRAAGAVVLGKTATTEFAVFDPGPTRNPHDPEHTPGGSSSGSAAAVAAGMVPLALGTQTAGSVIRPAAFCGVVGYKPSFGWVSRAGCLAVSDTLDTVGVFARTVDDAALLGGVLAGRDLGPGDPGAAEPPTLGLCRTTLWDRLDPEARSAVEAAAEAAGGHGAHLVELEPVDDYDAALEAQQVVMAYEAARELAFEWTAARDTLSPALRDLLARGEATSASDYDAALAVTAAARAQAAEHLTGVDATLTPSALGPAPRGLPSTGDPVCNRVWTLLGVPCLHLPFERTAAGLPLGVQLVAARGSDRALLQAGRWAARALGAEVAARPAGA